MKDVKNICGILYSRSEDLEEAINLLEAFLGKIDYRSKAFDFDVTDYYENEMGPDLKRLFVSFEEVGYAGDMVRIKKKAIEMEKELSLKNSRTVNLDTGYLDFHKLVLASTKFNGPKIYISDGMYADITLIYDNKKFFSPDRCFPDFKDGRYNELFKEIRNIYRRQIRI
ncbi:MAG: DUF4416 family protein [Pseudomonadota bacterium]